MNSFVKIAAIVISALTMQANAALVETDWKNSGDKQATLDTATGIEWLDLSLTAKVPLATLLTRMQSGDLVGWRFATESEVGTLNMHYDPSLHSTSLSYLSSTNGLTNAKMDPWRALFGQTHSIEKASIGVYQKDNGQWGMVGAYRPGLLRWYTAGFESSATLMATNVNTWAGYFLVSDGGTTLSSINDPAININNPNAPINTNPPVTPPTDVGAPLAPITMSMALMGILAIRRHRKQH